MKKLMIIILCFMLALSSVPDVFADETEETNTTETTSSGLYTVYLNTDVNKSFQWFVWTCGEGEDRWETGQYNGKIWKFSNLDSNVVFACCEYTHSTADWSYMMIHTVNIKLDGVNNMVVLNGDTDSEGNLTGYLTVYDESEWTMLPTDATVSWPTEPTEYTQPWETYPTAATDPIYTQPTQQTQATQATQATAQTMPTQPTQATQRPTQPTQATQATQRPTQPTQATQSTQSTQKPTNHTQPTVIRPTEESTESTDSSKQLDEVSPQLNLRTATVKCGKVINLKVKYNSSKKVIYTSNNSKVAKVSSAGRVSALKKGFARITASVGTQKLYFTIKVTTSPKLSKTSITVKKGKYKYVSIVGKASTVNNIYYNTNKAKILSKKNALKLKIKGLKKGKTTLKVKVNGVVLKLKVKVV